MPITNDLRAYADSAVQQGKQTFTAAQARVSGVTGQAGQLVNKFADGARGNVSELRSSTEKLVNIDARHATVDPHVAHLRSYGHTVTDRVGGLVVKLKNDPRVGKVFETADSVSTVVVERVRGHLPRRPA
jgi:hypothetical protein